MGRLAVPDAELPHLGVEIAGAQQGQPHRVLGPVSVEDVVVEIGVIGRVAHLPRRPQAAMEPLDPPLSRRGNRAAHEFLLGEGQHHVQLAATRQQRLGPEDVPSGGERAVGVAGWVAFDLSGDPRRHLDLVAGGKARVLAIGPDPVPAVVDNRRPREHLEQ